MNETFKFNADDLYYKFNRKSIDSDFLAIFCKPTQITKFLHNDIDFISLKFIKKISQKEVLTEKVLKDKYSAFYNETQFKKYINKKIIWKTFIKYINENINEFNNLLKTLIKKTELLKKQTGESKLKLAWPFVTGSIASENITTPLMYTPIVIDRTPDGLKIKKTKKTIYKINVNLLKFIYLDRKNIPYKFSVTLNSIEDVFKEYAKHGIKIKGSLRKVSDKVNPKKKEASFKENELKLVNNFVFENIAKSDEIFHDLIEIFKKHKEISVPIKNKTLFSKKDRTLVNRSPISTIDFNKSNIINMALKHSMVIWGPPGTGKSETLTALIAKIVSLDKSALVVSEKITPLNVIRKRLDKQYSLDNFVLRLSDKHLTNKQFYNKIIDLDRILHIDTLPIDISNLPNKYEEFIEQYWNFIEKINDKNISQKEFWELENKVRKINDKFGHMGKNILEIISSIRISKSKLNETEIKINKFIEILNDQYHPILIDSEDEILERLNFKLVPPLVYKNVDSISYKRILSLEDNIEELFDYLSDNQYGKFKKRSVLKKNRNYLNTIINLAHEIKFFHEKKEKNNLKTREELSYELKECKYKKSKIIKVFTKNAELYEIEEILKLTRNEILKLDFVSRMIVKNDFKNFINFQNTHAVLKSQNEKLILKAKESFLYSTIRKIKLNLNSSNILLNKYNALISMANFNESKRKNPLLVFKENFDLLRVIFPIMIAMPDDVSRLLPSEPNIFEYGIFDESSQMLLQTSLPSIHRTEKVIISGDNKQLAPTNYFKKKNVNLEDGVLNYSKISYQADSLLTWGQSCFVMKMLTSHYRSNHAKLIEYSNKKYYNNKLQIMNSPFAEKVPLETFLVDGIWENNINKKEVTKIISLVKEYIKSENFNTFGIIAFNRKQADLIIDSILKNSYLSQFYFEENTMNNSKKQIFVRNLENVQGEEADVIVLSVGYAKNADSNIKIGSLLHINDNRLNVAITRASKKMVVVKSISSNELITTNQQLGKYKLKEWLSWFEKNSNISQQEYYENSLTMETNHSKFKQEFIKKLSEQINENHYKLIQNNSKHNDFINLIICDNSNDKYILGISLLEEKPDSIIETLEQENMLENIGWTIHRVTPLSFYKNPDKIIKEIISKYLL